MVKERDLVKGPEGGCSDWRWSRLGIDQEIKELVATFLVYGFPSSQ